MKAKDAVYRLDKLPHSMNAGKETKVRALLSGWRQAAAKEAGAQWKLFFTNGRFNRMSGDKTHNGIVGAARLQMVRYQVVGQLESFISNRSNDFRTIVQNSSLAMAVKHQLHIINGRKAWYAKDEFTTKDGLVIDQAALRMARRIMRNLFNRHRKPAWNRIGMVIDRRGVSIETSKTKTFGYWLRLRTLDKPVQIPLKSYKYFEKRKGTLASSIQVSERDGVLSFGLIKDIKDTLSASRAAYTPRADVLAIDFGLRNMFTTDRGDILGRDWMDQLRKYDAKISKLGAYLQKHKIRPRESARYCRYVASLRGFIKSEVNRVLNQLIEVHAPAVLVVERLDFRNGNLSRRLNRLVTNCGRSVIEAKLKSLAEQYGIAVERQNAAYSSQECHSCGYTAKENRRSQEEFKCRYCGATATADVKAARTLKARRSRPEFSQRASKEAIFRLLARQFAERHQPVHGYRRDLRLAMIQRAGLGDQFT